MLNAIIDYQLWRTDTRARHIPPETAWFVYGFRTGWIALTGLAFLVFPDTFRRRPWVALQIYLALPLLFCWVVCGVFAVKAAVRRKQLGFILFTTDLTAREIVVGDWAWLSWITPVAVV